MFHSIRSVAAARKMLKLQRGRRVPISPSARAIA
jgi:hypothetical protein